MSRYQKTTGFVIKRINYAEADKIITIFTKEHGKKVYIAKGVRKIKSRRAGSLELFNHLQFITHQGKGMEIITETSLLDSYQSIASNYFKTTVAYQIIELIDRLTRDEQEQYDIYDLLNKALAYIKTTTIDQKKSDEILVRFKRRILELLGFGTPEITNHQHLTKHIEEIIERELVASKTFIHT